LKGEMAVRQALCSFEPWNSYIINDYYKYNTQDK
jgi:hypothetical protein